MPVLSFSGGNEKQSPLIKNDFSASERKTFSEIYYFNLMVSYLYSCNLFIGSNETGK